MGFGELLQKFYSGIIAKIISTGSGSTVGQMLRVLDPWKWGHPMTEGEAHFINDVVVYHYYGGPAEEEPEGVSDKGPRSLAEIYHNELKDEFGQFRRGWVAEYMADAFAENLFQESLFLFFARTGEGGRALLDSIDSFERHPGSPDGPVQEWVYAPFWATVFFSALTVVIAGLNAGGAIITDPTLWPMLLVLYLGYVKWYGGYGMHLPVLGTQSLVSAILTVVLFATSVRVFVTLVPFVDMSWFPMFWEVTPVWSVSTIPDLFGMVVWIGVWLFVLMNLYKLVVALKAVVAGIAPMLALGMIIVSIPALPIILSLIPGIIAIVNNLVIPNPVFLGLGPLIESTAWPTILLLWGIAGIGNIEYGEWAEHRQEEYKIAKHTVNLLKSEGGE